jgi:hypothetical protein
MKSLNSIKYILLALIVLGFFANFAQNEYGFDLIFYSLLGFFAIFISELIYYEIKHKPKVPKNKIRKKIEIIIYTIGTIIMVVVLINISYPKFSFLFPIFMGFIIIMALASVIILIMESIRKPLHTETSAFILLIFGFVFKYFHWPGGALIVLGYSVFFMTHFITQSVIAFHEIKKSNFILALWVLCFFLIVILSIFDFGLHFLMKENFAINIISTIILCLTFIFLLGSMNGKTYTVNSLQTTILGKITQIKGNIILLFLFYTLGNMWWLTGKLNLTPTNFYSESRPQALSKLWNENPNESKNKAYQVYSSSFYNFFENREKSMKNEQ